MIGHEDLTFLTNRPLQIVSLAANLHAPPLAFRKWFPLTVPDEPETLSYAITSICSIDVDDGHSADFGNIIPE